MVKISNGRAIRYVSLGAFNTIYKSKGYHIIDGKDVKSVKPVTEKVYDVSEAEVKEPEELTDIPSDSVDISSDSNEDWITDLIEKPVSQWTKEEVTNFVKAKDIDTSSAHKLSEVKDIIKNWIDQNR